MASATSSLTAAQTEIDLMPGIQVWHRSLHGEGQDTRSTVASKTVFTRIDHIVETLTYLGRRRTLGCSRPRIVPKKEYAVKVGDFQWVRIPPGQSVARPEATRAAHGGNDMR